MIAIRRRRVVVNLVDGRALMGERHLSWPWQVVLSRAELAQRDGVTVPLDGKAIIPRHRVDFVQVVG